MMKKYSLVLLIGALVTFTACDEDEPKVDPIVGLWELDRFEISNAPSGFSNVEGSGSTAFGEDSYTIEFFDDNTYEREITGIPNFGDIDDEGFWELNNGELELDSDTDEIPGLIYSFTIDGEITDREVLLTTFGDLPFQFSDQFIEDFNANVDTITSQESYEAILEANSQTIQVDFSFEFDRVN